MRGANRRADRPRVRPRWGGKSRLVGELVAQLRSASADLEVWSARTDHLDRERPLSLLARLLSIAGDPRWEELRPELEHREAVDRGDVPQAEELTRAFSALLTERCSDHPVVILVDGAELADFPSLRVLDRAVKDLDEAPLFLLATARPELHERSPSLWSSRSLHELRLGELSTRACERFARHMLGADADVEIVERLVRVSGGDPGLLDALARAAFGDRIDTTSSAVLVLLQARLAALPDDQRRCLRAATLLGDVFDRAAVSDLEGGGVTVDRCLEALVEKNILALGSTATIGGGPEYHFRDSLLREAMCELLVPEDRALRDRITGERAAPAIAPEELASILTA